MRLGIGQAVNGILGFTVTYVVEDFSLRHCFCDVSFSVVKCKVKMQSRNLCEAVHADHCLTLLLFVRIKQML